MPDLGIPRMTPSHHQNSGCSHHREEARVRRPKESSAVESSCFVRVGAATVPMEPPSLPTGFTHTNKTLVLYIILVVEL
eukprot:3933242-Rhodomonas_salina.1